MGPSIEAQKVGTIVYILLKSPTIPRSSEACTRSQKRQGTKAVLVKSELLCGKKKKRHIVVTYTGREFLHALDINSQCTGFQKQAFSQHGVLPMLERLPFQKFSPTAAWHYKVCAPIWSTMQYKCLILFLGISSQLENYFFFGLQFLQNEFYMENANDQDQGNKTKQNDWIVRESKTITLIEQMLPRYFIIYVTMLFHFAFTIILENKCSCLYCNNKE